MDQVLLGNIPSEKSNEGWKVNYDLLIEIEREIEEAGLTYEIDIAQETILALAKRGYLKIT